MPTQDRGAAMPNRYPDPGKPMTAEQIAAASRLADQGQQIPTDPYEFQTYRVLMQRGVPQAQAIEKARFWGALKRTDPTGQTVVGPADSPVAKLDQPRIETDP